MPSVNVLGEGVVDFPDTMSQEEIRDELRKRFPKTTPERALQAGVDISSRLPAGISHLLELGGAAGEFGREQSELARGKTAPGQAASALRAYENIGNLLTQVPEKVGSEALRTLRDVLSPTTYLPEAEQAKLRPFKISPEGIGQMTKAEAEGIQPGRSLLGLEEPSPDAPPNALRRLVEGATTPGAAVTLPFAETRAGATLFGLQGAKGLSDTAKVLFDPNLDPQVKREALESVPLNALMTRQLVRKGINAPQERIEQTGREQQYPGTETQRLPTEAVSGNRPVGEAPVQAEAPNVTQTTPKAEVPETPSQTGLRPAIRLMGGDVVVGDAGKTHPDIISENSIKATDIDQRGFADAQGNFLDREQAAAKTGLPTSEPDRLHSTDLPERQAAPAITGEGQPQAVTQPAPSEVTASTPVTSGAEPAEAKTTATSAVTQWGGPSVEQPAPPATHAGAAHVSEFERKPENPTSIKNAVVDRERAARGLPPAVQPARKSFGEVWDTAMQRIDANPGEQDALISDLRRKPRALTDEEDAMILQRQIDLQNEYDKASREVVQAVQDGRADDIAREQLRASWLSDQLLDLYDIGKKVGTETGRGLAARKLMANQDFSLAKMTQDARIAKGGRQLTADETAEIQRLHDEIRKKQEAYDQHVATSDARIAELESKLAHARMVKKRVKPTTSLDETKKLTQEKIRQKSDNNQLSDTGTDIQKLARAFVASGITEREALIDAVHAVVKEVLPDFTRRMTMDAISGYGQFKLLTKDEISTTLRGMKGEMQQLSKLEDMAKGQPPLKTGVERRTPTDAERALIKAVNDAKFKFQIPVQDPATQLKSALDTLKTTLRNRIVDLEQRIAKGDYSKRPRRELVLDSDAMKLKAEAEKVKRKFQEGLDLERFKNRQAFVKGADWLTKLRRFQILSSPISLAKLTAAAVQRLVFTPAEEVVGAGIGKAIPEVAKRAPREGGFNAEAEGRAIASAITGGMKDAWNTLKTGRSDLDILYGRRGGEPQTVLDFFGHVHGALKSPVKRAEFERSFIKRMAYEARNGVDVTNELVQLRVGLEAYKDANRSIFLQDNRVTDAYRAALATLQRKNKAGEVPVAGKTAATAARVFLPIVKVPTNIVAETLQHSVGTVTGSARLGRALYKGVENLKPEEADAIMRSLKKGSLGLAVMTLGYLNPDFVGGYFQPGEKRGKDEAKFGSIKLFGYNIPSFLLHNPLLETLQVGATIRRVADSRVKKTGQPKGISEGAYAAALGMGEQVPFVRETLELSKAFDIRQKGAFWGELAKSLIVPQAAQQAARVMDEDIYGNPIQRKPGTILEHIETGIPGLRQRVPKKTPDRLP